MPFYHNENIKKQTGRDMADSSKPIQNPVVVLREESDDWAILFNPDSGAAVGINPIGVYVWKLMDGKHALSEITALLGERFMDVPKNARKDIRTYISKLVKKGFVHFGDK
jgi:SynChlorMet cassette protein ScmD